MIFSHGLLPKTVSHEEVKIPIGGGRELSLESFQAYGEKKKLSSSFSIYNYPLISEQLQGTCKNENSRRTSIIQPKCVSPGTYFVLTIIHV